MPVTDEAVPATCTEGGEDVYTVTFQNPDFNEDEPTEGNTIKTVTTGALGHDWDEGQPIEGREGFLLYTCNRCGVTKEASADGPDFLP